MNSQSRKFLLRWVIPVLILIAPAFVPYYHINSEVSSFLTVVSLLFAILVGFFVGSATTNYFNVQSLIASEDSNLIALYNLGRLVQPEKEVVMAAVIDNYLIATFDYEFTDYVDRTEKEFKVVVDTVDSLEVSSDKQIAVFQLLHAAKLELIRIRQEAPLAARRIVGLSHWMVIILLAILINLLLLTLRDGSVIAHVITSVLALVSYLVLLLLYEIDGKLFMEQKLSFDNSQKVFKAIGKLPYYPESAIKSKRVQEPNESYRLGLGISLQQNAAREIKVVDR